MFRNSSITDSKRFSRYLWIIVVPYVCYYVSVLLFLFWPEPFYKRSWEYFRDIGYHKQGKRIWSGYEQGDYSLSIMASFSSERRKTRVSCDDMGFRSVPITAENYPIVVVGDCNIWGVNLDDCETIPWKLAETMHCPVFNGGRTPGADTPYLLENLINHPQMKNCKIIIEFVRDIIIDKNLFLESFIPRSSISFIKNKKILLKRIPSKRYFIFNKLIDHAHWLYSCFTATWDKDGLEKEIIVSRPSEDLDVIINNIKNRAESLQKMGYRYIFVPLPSRVLVMTKNIKGNPSELNKILVETLKQNGIEAIDLYQDFYPYKEGLFVEKDTHIGVLGASLIAKRLAGHLSLDVIYNEL